MEPVELRNEAERTVDFYRHPSCTESPVRITEIFSDSTREWLPAIVMGSDFAIHVRIQVLKQLNGSSLTIILKNIQGERVAVIFSWDHGFSLFLKPGEYVIRVRLNGLLLAPGRYVVDVGINQSTDTFAFDLIIDLPLFTVTNHGTVTQWLERPWGAVHWNNVTWETLEQA